MGARDWFEESKNCSTQFDKRIYLAALVYGSIVPLIFGKVYPTKRNDFR